MSVDTVNEALTAVRLRIAADQSNSFSREAKDLLLAMCSIMRDDLMKERINSFDLYIDSILARYPDAAAYLLDELFAELGFPEGTRDQLSAALAA